MRQACTPPDGACHSQGGGLPLPLEVQAVPSALGVHVVDGDPDQLRQ